MSQQIKHVLQKRLWPGVGGAEVFPKVVISVGMDTEILQQFRLPLAVIRPMGGSSDPNKGEEPKFIRQTFNIRLYAGESSDGVGEASLIGGHRIDGKLGSRGRGILEVEEQLIEAVGSLTGINGARVINRLRSMVDVILDANRRHIAVREYAFDAMVGNARFYHPSSRLAGALPGGGVVDLTWRHAPDRFDFVTQILRRAAGAVPPPSPTSGAGVALADPVNDVAVSDTPGAGLVSYSLFSMYDDLNIPPTDSTLDFGQETLSVTPT